MRNVGAGDSRAFKKTNNARLSCAMQEQRFALPAVQHRYDHGLAVLNECHVRDQAGIEHTVDSLVIVGCFFAKLPYFVLFTDAVYVRQRLAP